MKTIVYVDGFNLYYGLKHYERLGRLYKWLDLAALCQIELPNDTVTQIRYFTALVNDRPDKPGQQARQKAFIRALKTLPGLTVHYGKFLSDIVSMPLHPIQASGAHFATVVRTTEKGSDVNLATMLLCDAADGAFELGVVISNDSDLMLPIKVVQRKFRRQVGVLNPGQRISGALNKVATFYSQIQESSLRASQLPNPVADSQGRLIHKPAKW